MTRSMKSMFDYFVRQTGNGRRTVPMPNLPKEELATFNRLVAKRYFWINQHNQLTVKPL